MTARLFQHTIAEYTCTKRCGYHRSIVSPCVSRLYLIAAAVATIPLWLRSLFEPLRFPLHYLFSIFAGELLLFLAIGFASSILLMPFASRGTTICKQCGAPMFFAGQHFDPAGSRLPHSSDILILTVFAAINVCFWVLLPHGDL